MAHASASLLPVLVAAFVALVADEGEAAPRAYGTVIFDRHVRKGRIGRAYTLALPSVRGSLPTGGSGPEFSGFDLECAGAEVHGRDHGEAKGHQLYEGEQSDRGRDDARATGGPGGTNVSGEIK